MSTSIRPDPERAERNLRNAIRFRLAYVQVYGQDVVDILAELDKVRAERDQFQAAAVTALEQRDPAHPRTMKAAGRVVGAMALLLALLPALASAQTPPVLVGPSLALTVYSPSNVTCAGVEQEQWTLFYGQPCSSASAPVVAVPFVRAVLVRLTPVTLPDQQPTPTIVRVPRANVFRTPDAAGCAPTKPPCLSVRVASLPGQQSAEWAFEDAEGQTGPWFYAGIATGRASLVATDDGRVRP
jgi:hypothetical protein